MIAYVGYDRWFDFDEICNFLNHHVHGFRVIGTEKKDFRKAIEEDVPNQIYKRHTWWKESDLSKFFCEKFPKVNFAHSFRTYRNDSAIEHFADEKWFSDEYVRAHKIMAECAEKITKMDNDESEERFIIMQEYARAKTIIRVLESEFLPRERYAYLLHSAHYHVANEERYRQNLMKQMLCNAIKSAKENKKFNGETLEEVLSRNAQKGES